MEIEFLLAVQDPEGNPTNGIVRKNMSEYQNYVKYGIKWLGDEGIDPDSNQLLNSLWDQEKYLNIFLVHKIDETPNKNSGFSSMAINTDGPQMVFISTYPFIEQQGLNLTHEIGHQFNLDHPFSNDYHLQCKDGDGIDDTPKQTNKYTSQSGGINSSDQNNCDPDFSKVMSPRHKGNGTMEDIMHNYMSYFPDEYLNEFTYGQRNVAKYTLKNERSLFLPKHGNSKLVSALEVPPTVDFFSPTLVIKGSPVAFFDQTFGIPNNYINSPNASLNNETFLWTFDNGVDDPMTSTDQI